MFFKKKPPEKEKNRGQEKKNERESRQKTSDRTDKNPVSLSDRETSHSSGGYVFFNFFPLPGNRERPIIL